jgi:hypothetical protein
MTIRVSPDFEYFDHPLIIFQNLLLQFLAMAAYSEPMSAPGSLSNFTQFINTTTATPMIVPIRPGKETKEGKTELIFCWGFLAIVFIAFASLLAIDVYHKHGPERDANERSFIMKRFDKAHEKYYICKDNFNRLFIWRKKNVGDVEHAVARDFDSQTIIDRLAAKPASAEAATLTENTAGKTGRLMERVAVTVTPLDMSFLEHNTVEDAAVESITFEDATVENIIVEDANAGYDKAASL